MSDGSGFFPLSLGLSIVGDDGALAEGEYGESSVENRDVECRAKETMT